MKTNKTIRSIVAMMVIFFAVSTTSCKKEENITPANPAAPNVPVVPPIPAVPAVSMKPKNIITTQNGSAIRKEQFIYNTQGNLIKYESSDVTLGIDSVLLFSNSTVFKQASQNASQVLSFNADKTFKSLFIGAEETAFTNNQNKLQAMSRRVNNVPRNVGEFQYSNNNMSTIGAEIRIDINYHNNLPYQKGINEIPVALKPIKFYKVMEIEDATTTVLYSKLIRQVILSFGGGRFETHDYTYVFDANNRVTKITDTITNTTSTTSSQKIIISSVNY